MTGQLGGWLRGDDGGYDCPSCGSASGVECESDCVDVEVSADAVLDQESDDG